jgi:hypothetical protein
MSRLTSKPSAAQPSQDQSSVSAVAAPPQITRTLWITMGLWLVLVLGMGIVLQLHATQPGAVGKSPATMPSALQQELAANRPVLLVFAHPYCPCVRATLGELEAILRECSGLVSARVIFVVPRGETIDWEHNELLQHAKSIAGVTISIDADASEALNCGARTSGMTLLFDHQGKRLFYGGITISRGHAGENLGRQAIISFLTTGSASINHIPTYGCPLFDEGVSVLEKVNP